MFNYFYDLFSGFLGVDNVVISTALSQLLCIFLCIVLIYLLSKLIFPKDSIVKKVGFCLLMIASVIIVLSSNGVSLVTITQTLAQVGGV